MSNFKAHSITVGDDCIGVVCNAYYNATNAVHAAIMQLGFSNGYEYEDYYPCAERYFQHQRYKYGLGVIAGLYGVHLIDDPKLSHSRIRLHETYAHFNSHGKMLLIFPTVNQIKEAFAYKKLIPSANFWFCSDWKEGD